MGKESLFSLDRVFGRSVDPTTQRVVKILPNNPPRRGETLVVDGARVKVVRSRVLWEGRQWTIRSLRVHNV